MYALNKVKARNKCTHGNIYSFKHLKKENNPKGRSNRFYSSGATLFSLVVSYQRTQKNPTYSAKVKG